MNVTYVEEQMKTAVLTPREKCLVSLLFGETLTEDASRILFDGFDFNTANQNYLLMLSSLGYLNEWKYFPPEMLPRLKGIHRYHQVHNAMGLPWLVRQIRKLADDGIPVMLLKGAAMLIYYAPDRPRLMWDYDIAVPKEHFDRALHLLWDEENAVQQTVPYSATIKNNHDELDMHCWIFKTCGERDSDIWERAVSFQFHGVNVLVLTPEDMLIHLLDTQSRNYFSLENIDRRMQWLCDCRCIWGKMEKLDLKHLSERAKQFYAQSRVRMMLLVFMQCFPELIDPEKFQTYFPQTEDYNRLLIRGEKFREAMIRFKSYGYPNGSILTLPHIWRILQRDLVKYPYWSPELMWAEPKMNFIRFLKITHKVDSFSALFKRFLSRIRLFRK